MATAPEFQQNKPDDRKSEVPLAPPAAAFYYSPTSFRELAGLLSVRHTPISSQPVLNDTEINAIKQLKEAHEDEKDKIFETDRGQIILRNDRLEHTKAYSEDDYKKLIENLTKQLQYRQKTYGADSAPVAETLRLLGGYSKNSGQLQEAIKYYSQGATVAEKAFGSENIKTAQAYADLANIYFEARDWAKAVPIYEKSLRMMHFRATEFLKDSETGQFTTRHNYNAMADMVELMKNYAGAFQALGQQTNADNYIQQAMKLETWLEDEYHDQMTKPKEPEKRIDAPAPPVGDDVIDE